MYPTAPPNELAGAVVGSAELTTSTPNSVIQGFFVSLPLSRWEYILTFCILTKPPNINQTLRIYNIHALQDLHVYILYFLN